MSLEIRVTALAQEIGRDIKRVRPTHIVPAVRYEVDASFIYTAYQQINGTDYTAIRRSMTTNATATATGTLPVPADIKTLTYT